MIPFERGSRSRCARQLGYTGRKRHYKCNLCGQPFMHDGNQLPIKSRVCYQCRLTPEGLAQYDHGFIDKHEQDMKEGLIP